jgi:hypothetical protein
MEITTLDGKPMEIQPVEFEIFIPTNVERHQSPSLELTLPEDPLERIIATLQKDRLYTVNLVTDPYYGQIELYESRSHLGLRDLPLMQEKTARKFYEGLKEVLASGNYRIHLFPNKVIGFEEI